MRSSIFSRWMCVLVMAILPGLVSCLEEENLTGVQATRDVMEGEGSAIYLAGGCFWGVEQYFALVPGVLDAVSGYAQGHVKNPSYEEVCSGTTGHTETVRVVYDPGKVSLGHLLELYYDVIDPYSLNKQGNDRGTQYRTGIYYTTEADGEIARKFIAEKQSAVSKKIVATRKTAIIMISRFFI